MEWFIGAKEVFDAEKLKADNKLEFDKKTIDKYDKILGDDKLSDNLTINITSIDIDKKFSELFESGNSFDSVDKDYESYKVKFEEFETESDSNKNKDDLNVKEFDLKEELDNNEYELDDNGVKYKENGVLLANNEYVINGHIYRTDQEGRIKSCDGKPQYTYDGNRNVKEQKESGGDERKEHDDGGHIFARILNGSEGSENLIPMRRTINRGDYKKMENDIVKSLQENKKVTMHVDIEYVDDSKRPSKLICEYNVDEKKTVIKFDNEEKSIDLLDSLKGKISDRNYKYLKDEIEDMKEDGLDVSITSIKTEYDDNGNADKIVVGLFEETEAKKTYKVYEPRKEV